MTLKEYLQHKAAGEAVPPLDFSNLAVKLLRVSACLCTWHIEQGPLLLLCHALATSILCMMLSWGGMCFGYTIVGSGLSNLHSELYICPVTQN